MQSTASTTLGHLSFHLGTRKVTAHLNDDLTWTCEDPPLQSYMNQVFESQPQIEADDEARKHYLYRVASRLGAQVTVG